MRRRLISVLVLVLAALSITLGAMTVLQPAVAGSATSCTTKHCQKNTHCCIGCNGSPICVRNGAPCPECAPM